MQKSFKFIQGAKVSITDVAVNGILDRHFAYKVLIDTRKTKLQNFKRNKYDNID
jgi:hypothetical protein